MEYKIQSYTFLPERYERGTTDMTDYSQEEYSEYRLQRALETINEVKTHIENEFFDYDGDTVKSLLPPTIDLINQIKELIEV